MHVVRTRGRVAALFGAGLMFLTTLTIFVPGASSQEPGEPIDLRGFATGQPGHVSAAEFGGTRIANTEVAWSGASVDADADGLRGSKANEFARIFQPNRNGKLTYARGSGLEIGLGTSADDPATPENEGENQIPLAAIAEQDAPPDNDEPATEEIAVEGASPLAYASLVRGQALANSNDSGLVPDVCVLGDDLSRGLGYAADVELLDAAANDETPGLDAPVLALDDTDPQRSVSNSVSRTKLVPSGQPNNFGLMSEVRQTIAPVTLLQADTPADPDDDPRLLTIELLGEWVLRVVANGRSGGASVFYGPGEVSPETPILRIIDSEAVTNILTFQDIFGEEGLPIVIPGLAEVTIGEDPRAIAAPGTAPDAESKPKVAANGTSASAAVDVLRIRLLSADPGQPVEQQLADIRVGHMEVSTEVPVGGVDCPIPVTKTADPDAIKIKEEPDTSTIEITVHNVYDCDLTETVLTDRIRQNEASPDFKLISADPAAESPDMPTGVLTSADVVWNLGTIKAGDQRSVTLELQSAEEGGILRDIAEAVGKFANCAGEDASGLAISGLQLSGLSAPVDISIETPVTGAAAARTVATGGGLTMAAAALGLVFRRRFARKT